MPIPSGVPTSCRHCKRRQDWDHIVAVCMICGARMCVHLADCIEAHRELCAVVSRELIAARCKPPGPPPEAMPKVTSSASTSSSSPSRSEFRPKWAKPIATCDQLPLPLPGGPDDEEQGDVTELPKPLPSPPGSDPVPSPPESKPLPSPPRVRVGAPRSCSATIWGQVLAELNEELAGPPPSKAKCSAFHCPSDLPMPPSVTNMQMEFTFCNTPSPPWGAPASIPGLSPSPSEAEANSSSPDTPPS